MSRSLRPGARAILSLPRATGAVGLGSREVAGDPGRAVLTVRVLTYLVVLGMGAAFLWAYWAAMYDGLPYPRSTFLFNPTEHFQDLSNLYASMRAHDPYAYSSYPPFSFLVVAPFAWLGGTAAQLLYLGLVLGGLGAYVAWQLDYVPRLDRAAAVVVLTAVTYPFLFAFDRGNIEVFVTLLLAAFVWGLQTEHDDLAAVAIGAAAALKVYPVVFALLFLIRGRWRPLAITVATIAVLSFLGSGYYGFDLPHAISLFRQNARSYNDVYVIGDAGLGWGCSLFGPLKLLLVDVLGGSQQTVRHVLPFYTAVTGAVWIAVAAAIWRLPLRFWEQITLLTIAMTVLPAASGDYKLLHLVVPMALFLRGGTDDPRYRWYLTGFAALMVPKAYVLLRPDGTNLGVVLDPVIMSAIGLAIIAAGLLRRQAGSLPGAAQPRSV